MVTPPSPAQLGQQVDRLVIGVHRSVFDIHRPEIAALLDPLNVPARAQLLDLAEFFLDEAFKPQIAYLRFRYTPVSSVRTKIEEWFASGVVTQNGLPSDKLRAVFESLLRARAHVCRSFWDDSELEMVIAGATGALDQSSGPLCDPFKQLSQPAAPAPRLHHLLTGLRYARMDAHHDAWRSAGLEAQEIVALSTAAAEAGPDVAPLPSLLDRGWLTSAGQITSGGRSARAAIEADTNARCQPILDGVPEPARWFQALKALPDTAR